MRALAQVEMATEQARWHSIWHAPAHLGRDATGRPPCQCAPLPHEIWRAPSEKRVSLNPDPHATTAQARAGRQGGSAGKDKDNGRPTHERHPRAVDPPTLMATGHAIQAAIRPRCHRTSAAAQRVQQRGSISVGKKRIRDLPGVHL